MLIYHLCLCGNLFITVRLIGLKCDSLENLYCSKMYPCWANFGLFCSQHVGSRERTKKLKGFIASFVKFKNSYHSALFRINSAGHRIV